MDLDQLRTVRGFAPLIEYHMSTLFPFSTKDEFNRKVLAVNGLPVDEPDGSKMGLGSKDNIVSNVDEFANADQVALSALLDAIRPDLHTEGCWRKTGSLPRIKQLLLDPATGQISDSENEDGPQFSVHDRCSAVKKLYTPKGPLVSFLALLADTFFVEEPHQEEKGLKALQCYNLLRPMDVPTRHLLATLVETVKLESQNRMSAEALATVFIPVLFTGDCALLPNECASRHTLLRWLLSSGFSRLQQNPVPYELREDLIRLERQELANRKKQRNENVNSLDSTKKKKRKQQSTANNDADDEVYTSVRFCANSKPPGEEVEDITARELAKLYATISQSNDKKLIERFSEHNRNQLTPAKPKTKFNTPLMARLVSSLRKKKKDKLADDEDDDGVLKTPL